MAINIKELMNKANSVTEVTAGNTSGGTSKMSVTIVYSRNGKRLTISKKLADTLKLTDVAQISFIIDEGIILLGKVTSEVEENRIEMTLKDDFDTIKETSTGRKIAYNADAVLGIVKGFQLDYSKCSSKSFDKIEIDSSDPDNPIAVIKIGV